LFFGLSTKNKKRSNLCVLAVKYLTAQVESFRSQQGKWLLSGDGRAVFEVLYHGKPLKIRLKARGVRFKVAPQLLRNKRDLRFDGLRVAGHRSNCSLG